MNDKERIAHSFGKAAQQYNQQATVQREMVERLLDHLASYAPIPQGGHLLEVGCGTGMLSHRLVDVYAPSRLVMNDIAPEMEQYLPSGNGWEFLCADAETAPFEGEFDLIISSSTIQWFQNPAAFLDRMARHLKEGGILAIATFGKENLHQLASLTGGGLHYFSREEYEQMLGNVWERPWSSEALQSLYFPTAKELFAHLRQTGVNGVASTQRSLRDTRQLIQKYQQQFAEERGVPLTYHPLYLLATKKEIQ